MQTYKYLDDAVIDFKQNCIAASFYYEDYCDPASRPADMKEPQGYYSKVYRKKFLDWLGREFPDLKYVFTYPPTTEGLIGEGDYIGYVLLKLDSESVEGQVFLERLDTHEPLKDIRLRFTSLVWAYGRINEVVKRKPNGWWYGGDVYKSEKPEIDHWCKSLGFEFRSGKAQELAQLSYYFRKKEDAIVFCHEKSDRGF